MKKITCLFLFAAFLMLSCVPAFAAEKSPNKKMTYYEIIKEYNLKPVTEIPKGVKPIEVNSEEELLQLLQNLEKETYISEPIITTFASSNYIADEYNIMGVAKIVLYVRVETNNYRVTDAKAYSKLTGLTAGLEWVPIDEDCRILSNGKDVKAWSYGVLNHYILVNGLLKMYSKDIDLEGYLTIFH